MYNDAELWTADAPTVAGWYWWRCGTGVAGASELAPLELVEYLPESGGMWRIGWNTPQSARGEYLGPIPEPRTKGEPPEYLKRPVFDTEYGMWREGPGPQSAAATPQPDPEPYTTSKPAIAALVMDDVKARMVVGIETYGVPLQPFNGRDALMDAYQEALDLACYLRQAIWERDRK